MKRFLKRKKAVLPLRWNQVSFGATVRGIRSLNRIKARAPSDYFSEITPGNFDRYLDNALIPKDIMTLSYENFLERRKDLLENKARELMG